MPLPLHRPFPAALFAVAVAAVLAGAVQSPPAIGEAAPSQQTEPVTQEKPDIVLIVTDDQRPETLRFMPHVRDLLTRKGTRFANAMVPTSLCCPSRATIMTGRYAHTSRVFGNGDIGGKRWGGWQRFHDTRAEQQTVAVALQGAGYRTALVGKYLNFFGRHSEETYGPGYVPPGWDRFFTFLSDHGAYYNYRLSDGSVRADRPEDYSTDVFAAEGVRFLQETPPEQPAFLFFAPYGPHKPYLAAPRHKGTLEERLGTYAPRTLHQKSRTLPRWMRVRERTTQREVEQVRLRQHEAMLAVDDAVASIVGALEASGRARNTLFVFTSDNGYFWGEHRIIGKDAPYRVATEVPMILRWDGHLRAGEVSKRIVLNVDLAETLTRAAGVDMATDGLDILGSTRRSGFVLEAMEGYHERPAYCGWRTKHRMYVRWATGEEELYDYRRDPHEQRNLVEEPEWHEVVDRMRAHAKQECRPLPPKFRWNRR